MAPDAIPALRLYPVVASKKQRIACAYCCHHIGGLGLIPARRRSAIDVCLRLIGNWFHRLRDARQ